MATKKILKYQGDVNEFRSWHDRQGYTYESGAAALGVSRAAYAMLLAGTTPIDLRTGLACAAIEMGIRPLKKMKLIKEV